MNCVQCNKKFHTCSSCGLVGAEWDYCSEACYIAAGSPTHGPDGDEYDGIAFMKPLDMKPLQRPAKSIKLKIPE